MTSVQHVEIKADRKLRSGYSSPLIQARRHRILSETRKIISEQGLSAISMEDVASRAGVAKRTIYNAFQSKERLIATAIQRYFDKYAAIMVSTHPEGSLDWMMERIGMGARSSLEAKNYTRALMNIYFTHEVDPEIRRTIYNFAAGSASLWAQSLHSKRQLQPWTNKGDLVASLVAYRYSIAFDWAEGQIKDEAFIPTLLRGVLMLSAGATRGRARKEIEDRLATLESNPLLVGNSLSDHASQA